MSKCFITKLPSSVDNDNLPVLGQLRIKWLKQDSLTDNDARFVELQTNDSIVVKVSGAHFTDNTLTSNIGNIKTIKAVDGLVPLYISNDVDAVLTIDNKYSLTKLNFVKDDKYTLKHSVYFDIEDIRGCTNLVYLRFTNTQVSGDISALSNLTNLISLGIDNTQVSGDISALSNLTSMSRLVLNNTKVYGDISALSKLTGLTYISLSYIQLRGNVDNFAGMTRLEGAVLAELKNLSLAGDMSKIPAKVSFISQMGRKIDTNFTWTAKGRQNATLLAMEGSIPFDTASMDNMLIDQATCTLRAETNAPWAKVISVNGTRTSASDAAVTAIQNMGVTITGVTKQA